MEDNSESYYQTKYEACLEALTLIVHFNQTEMGWEWFREEFNLGDGQSGKNAQAVQDFLQDHKGKFPDVWADLNRTLQAFK